MKVYLGSSMISAEPNPTFSVTIEPNKAPSDLRIEGESVVRHDNILRTNDISSLAKYQPVLAKVLAWMVNYMEQCYPNFVPTAFEFLNSKTLLVVGKTKDGTIAGLVGFAALKRSSSKNGPQKYTVAMSEPIVGAYMELQPHVIAIVTHTASFKLGTENLMYPETAAKLLMLFEPITISCNELITLQDINSKLDFVKPKLTYTTTEKQIAIDESVGTGPESDLIIGSAEGLTYKLDNIKRLWLQKQSSQERRIRIILARAAIEALKELTVIDSYKIEQEFETHRSRYIAECTVYSYKDLAIVTIDESLYANGYWHVILHGMSNIDFGYHAWYVNSQDLLGFVMKQSVYEKNRNTMQNWLYKTCLHILVERGVYWIGWLYKDKEVSKNMPEKECVEIALCESARIPAI